MVELVYVDEQPGQAHHVLRRAVASKQFSVAQVKTIMPASTMDETIDEILSSHCKVLITDYRLSEHKADVQYNGAELVREFQRRFDRFPCFVTTAFAGEAVDEAIDTNIVFPKSDFLGEEVGGDRRSRSDLPFFVRVRKKISEYDAFVAAAMEEWRWLGKKQEQGDGLTAQEVERLLELDDKLEALHGRHVAVEGHLKRNALDTFERIIEKAETLIAKIEREIL